MADRRGRGRDARARTTGTGRGRAAAKPRSTTGRSARAPASTGGSGARSRPAGPQGARPRLTRARSRAGEVVARTTGLLGLSSTKRAAILAIVVCALALTVAVPLHNFVAQRQELSDVSDRQQALEADVARLAADRARLSDPAEVEAQARARLGMVEPGETPYVPQFPAPPAPVVEDGQAEPGVPWFHTLWNDVVGDPRR
ncbi:Cell division protein DivIC (FtsB), stabilizes FtsL against RasP cleavage [Pseudonocardia sp. Ae406_Ps2]|uniref:FtsB family cell division protein n=1 Tax=unclassified Pseudonocardia TaxID=2619320 RepID=UPI00094ABD05|nr:MULTISPECIES: septum formation initiator family protein [unclassified Pseudonocardia]OLL99362.1 Cell division protein DivIC (FtsB), stabilizes FtsL against RasP cleavage [Pseudonocardia sp. Ae331_Ps2]OLM02897.1 Cell division protein DivIC (FtsB), stabilizes FtsL against RasP cleavage [Pseudonocardia sp. Ae406_Ps2]OLM12251.1 Cell division protein DivIC (FtsB), stabilizes FtsL against RasP cleavage [Pseudonocardia sp. Ae505_Ps2]OLM24475.1 Cell division protein DivIC (FtsB), stabilizes FtsL aga